jgi:ubiquinone biosynthesis accessory factor UbiJ
MMILSALLKPMEKLVNGILALDKEKAQQLQSLAGKVIQIQFLPIDFSCYLIIHHHTVQLANSTDEFPHTVIRGTPIALTHLLYHQAKMLPENVSITGDLLVLQSLKNIIGTIEIDWEEQLARYIGDIAAHTVCQQWRNMCRYQRNAITSFIRSNKEFWQEELQIFPPRNELTDFFDDVDTLRNDVERLAARIELILQSETC